MNTDHTETPPFPQVQTLHHLAEQTGPMRISFFLDNYKETGALFMTDPMTFEGNIDESAKLFFETVVQQHSTAMAQARAALATAVEERDADNKEHAAILQECKDWYGKQLSETARERDALRAQNDALTKALEGAEELFHTALERVEAKREYDADPQVTCRRCGIADQDLATAVEKYSSARRALGKEGL